MDDTPVIAFEQHEPVEPAIEVRVNFGMFAGREATPAEIDELARALATHVAAFAIVSEQRHEFANEVEAAVHQVVISVESAPGEVGALRKKIVETAETWAEACIADRHVEVAEI
jgi:hypothetical protein